jgi:hypothetical protein
MNTLVNNRQYRRTLTDIRKNNQNEALTVFNALTLKEKCLYLVKISKRNTGYQSIVLMGLALVIIAANYLFTMIV